MVSSISLLAVVAFAAVASAVPTGHKNCVCPFIMAPVCASNGKVFNNACMLKCYNQENNADLKIVHEGSCGKLHSNVNENEIEAESADFCTCTREFRPVCGSDQQTYSNMCMLKCAAKKNHSLRMLHDGSCDLPLINFKLDWPLVHEMPDPEDDEFPDFELMAKKESADSAACICTMEYAPVCGTNLHTYSNKCFLECDMKKDESLQMLYPTICIILP